MKIALSVNQSCFIVKRICDVLSLLIILVIAGGCSREDRVHELIDVDVETFAPVTDFFDDSRFVILETNDSSIIGERFKIRFDADYHRIVAFSAQTGFTVFDGNGKWISSFNHKGEGPEEYIGITDFYLYGDNLFAVDCYRSKILVFSLDSGDCKRVIPLGDNYAYATWLDDRYIALCAAYNSTALYNIALLDVESGEIDKRFMPYKHSDSATYGNYEAFVGRDADGLFVTLPFNTTLYRLTADTCVVAERYQFNTPDQLPPVESEYVNMSDMEEMTRTSRCVKWLGFFSKPSADLCYQAFELLTDYGNKTLISKYNPISGESRTMCIDSTDEFPYLIWKPVLMNDEYYICAPKAEFVLNYEEISGKNRFSTTELTRDSNPVIFFYHLKQSW